jgi:glycosyltransferase involved in cell wall biosynthesis
MYGGIMAGIITRTVNDRPTVVSFCGSDLLGEHLSGALRKLIAGYGVRTSRRAARRAWGIIVKSKNLRDALPDDVDQCKVRVIANGVDLERFKPLDRDVCRKRLSWCANRFHVLFPANSGDPVKRPDLAQAAVRTVNRLGVPAELHYLRNVPHDEVPIWLNASDVVLLTSLHEGSPNIVKESLACDVPVVSVNVGDVRERLQDIVGCYLAQPEPYDLATKLHRVRLDPGRVAGRIRIQELSSGHVALRLKGFYDELLVWYRMRGWPDVRG